MIGNFLFSQENYPNCTHPKKIEIPFESSTIETSIEEIYYQPEDDYTYWYQISVQSDCILKYKMSLINEDDDYEFLIYNYQGNNFCNSIINKKIIPFSIAKEGTLNLKQGESYFFNVVYLNGNGCGHNLSLSIGDNNMDIKAIQNGCVEEVMEEIVAEEQNVVEEIVEEIIAEEQNVAEPLKSVKIENGISGLVINGKTKRSVDAQVSILPYNSVQKQEVRSVIGSGFVLDNFSEKKVVIAVNKFGYKDFTDTIAVTSGSFIIELIPISVGDKLIMKKVYFHPNTYVLKEESKKELHKLLAFMLENTNSSFEIQGHTNGNRSVKRVKKYAHLGDDWNFKGSSKKLSKLRAEKIKTFLIENGVSGDQLETEGYGGDKMIISKPKNMSQAMKNIRVEVIVIQ